MYIRSIHSGIHVHSNVHFQSNVHVHSTVHVHSNVHVHSAVNVHSTVNVHSAVNVHSRTQEQSIVNRSTLFQYHAASTVVFGTEPLLAHTGTPLRTDRALTEP